MQGRWYVGDAYDVNVALDGRDTYPNDFKCKVWIREKATGAIHKRRGYGKFLGNFSFISVDWHGERVLLEELLRRSSHEKHRQTALN